MTPLHFGGQASDKQRRDALQGEIMSNTYGKWKIEKSLGEGGQAHIFLAKNDEGDFGVIKRLKNINRKNRFITEIESIKDDPNGYYPKILNININSDKPYFVMEYFPKGGLSERHIKDWNLHKKCEFFVNILHAVSYAHSKNVIHRDLKPENILVDENDLPKVSDFGICFINDFGERQTLSVEAVGSFRYMAPELESGKSDLIGPYTDVYALGKIAYWLFSNGKMYNREIHRDDEFNLTNMIDEKWTYYLNDFIDKATAKVYSNRIQNCSSLLEEFDKVKKAIHNNLRYLDFNVEQECAFCGVGYYDTVVDSLEPNGINVTAVKNFGYIPIGNSKWLIMVCNTCGNVQTFRKDKCKNWLWK